MHLCNEPLCSNRADWQYQGRHFCGSHQTSVEQELQALGVVTPLVSLDQVATRIWHESAEPDWRAMYEALRVDVEHLETALREGGSHPSHWQKRAQQHYEALQEATRESRKHAAILEQAQREWSAKLDAARAVNAALANAHQETQLELLKVKEAYALALAPRPEPMPAATSPDPLAHESIPSVIE